MNAVGNTGSFRADVFTRVSGECFVEKLFDPGGRRRFSRTAITYAVSRISKYTRAVLRAFRLPVFVVLARQWDAYCAIIITVIHIHNDNTHARASSTLLLCGGRRCSPPPETAVFLLLIFIQFYATPSNRADSCFSVQFIYIYILYFDNFLYKNNISIIGYVLVPSHRQT